MTLVGTLTRNDENALPKMLGIKQQQHHHHHHHHHVGIHGGLNNASPLTGNNGQSNRGNVIVSTGGLSSTNDLKASLHQQQQQHQQQQNACKRSKMYQSTPYGTGPHQPASVARRNARERNRVKQVNNGFATLRQHIPQSVAQALGGKTAGTHGGPRAGSKQLSKVETLRMAVEYIRSLQRLLDDHDGTDGSSMLSSSSSPALSTCGTGSIASSGSRSDHLDNSPHCGELRNNGTSGDVHHSTNNVNVRHQHMRQNDSPTSFVPPPCSEASSSPTPSFVSEASSAGSQGYGSTSTNGPLYTTHGDSYDNYEPMSPEDEELLDVISWWQQSQ